ncbi:MAG: hypothetical protein ACK5KM_04480 [Hyphomicrobiaceae bacterium]
MRFLSESAKRSCRWIFVSSAFLAIGATSAVAASEGMLGVSVENKSEPVLCAEKDNVTLTFSAPEVTRFSIEAAHPAYTGTRLAASDSFEPDWTACEFKTEATAPAQPPERTTIYEDIDLWVVAHRYESFWRNAGARVVIGDKSHEGVHLLQVWVIRPMGGEEVLVLYPQDGYWRMRPKAPTGHAPTAFGSSFLIGPVTQDSGRPVVDIEQVEFDPKARTFTLTYRDGNSSQVALGTLDNAHHQLQVTFAKPVSDKPFAALRSMFVTRFNNDVAQVAVREKSEPGWRESAIMDFKGAKSATDIWTGRLVPSRHNTSAPDMTFGTFSDTAMPPPVGWRDPSKPPPNAP